MLGGQRPKRARRFPVVLNENDIPDLNNIRIIGVYEISRLASTNSVKVDFSVKSGWFKFKLMLLTCKARMVR